MNKLRVYLSSGARMASRCGLLAIAGAMAAQTMPLTREEAQRRAEARLRKKPTNQVPQYMVDAWLKKGRQVNLWCRSGSSTHKVLSTAGF